MTRVQLGSPQEAELTNLVLKKLADIGCGEEETVLANFIVVMVANEKTREEIAQGLEEIIPDNVVPEFVQWLFQYVDMPEQMSAPVEVVSYIQESQPEPMEESQSRPAPTDTARGSRRMLMTAISGATRSEPAPARQAPTRVYESERRAPREASTSPDRNRERRGKEESIRFRRTSEERSREESRIDARLGNSGNAGGKGDRLRGRLGRIEDRLGWKQENNGQHSDRERSWDRDDYHGKRGGRNNHNNNNRNNTNNANNVQDRANRLRDLESRLGGPVVSSEEDNDIPRQPAGWSAAAERDLANANASKLSRCRFWPNCAQGDMCQFWHPKELCPDFPNCPNPANSCMYVHPLAEPTAEQAAAAARQALLQSMRNGNSFQQFNPAAGMFGGNGVQTPFGQAQQQECKFGARCTRPDCKFRHSERDAMKQKCRFFPKCTKPDCPFYHPPYGESLAPEATMDESGAEKMEDRLPTPCRFGDMCTRPGCHFTHPRDGGAIDGSAIPLCKFNPCTRVGCHFRHVPGGAAGGHNKTLVLNGNNTSGSRSERFAGGVVDENEVEKLHVPASSHWASGGVSHGTNNLNGASNQATEAAQLQIDAEMEMEL
ncbi:hypothetical protein BGZ83_008459 [Gryganskiella cystojenkinii]|nr:hypothetical protein BGZ83_008459 [Gryganskiella cystojenkinii]